MEIVHTFPTLETSFKVLKGTRRIGCHPRRDHEVKVLPGPPFRV